MKEDQAIVSLLWCLRRSESKDSLGSNISEEAYDLCGLGKVSSDISELVASSTEGREWCLPSRVMRVSCFVCVKWMQASVS